MPANHVQAFLRDAVGVADPLYKAVTSIRPLPKRSEPALSSPLTSGPRSRRRAAGVGWLEQPEPPFKYRYLTGAQDGGSQRALTEGRRARDWVISPSGRQCDSVATVLLSTGSTGAIDDKKHKLLTATDPRTTAAASRSGRELARTEPPPGRLARLPREDDDLPDATEVAENRPRAPGGYAGDDDNDSPEEMREDVLSQTLSEEGFDHFMAGDTMVWG